MGQIAQQDNFIFLSETENIADDPNWGGGEVKEKLIECVKNGTISDVLIKAKRNEKIHDITTVYSWGKETNIGEQHVTCYSINVVKMSLPDFVRINLE